LANLSDFVNGSHGHIFIVSINHRPVHGLHLDKRERFRLESRAIHAVYEVDYDLKTI